MWRKPVPDNKRIPHAAAAISSTTASPARAALQIRPKQNTRYASEEHQPRHSTRHSSLTARTASHSHARYAGSLTSSHALVRPNSNATMWTPFLSGSDGGHAMHEQRPQATYSGSLVTVTALHGQHGEPNLVTSSHRCQKHYATARQTPSTLSIATPAGLSPTMQCQPSRSGEDYAVRFNISTCLVDCGHPFSLHASAVELSAFL